jgi:hypothetical protein
VLTSTARLDAIIKVVAAWASLPLLLAAASIEMITFTPEARTTGRVIQLALALAGGSLLAATWPRFKWVGLLVFVACFVLLVGLACGLRW